MLMKNLARAIEKRGGKATIAPDQVGRMCLTGTLNNHDVHMYPMNGESPEHNTYFTVRPIARRGQNDLGSDYNPGGYTFCNRLRDLDWSAR